MKLDDLALGDSGPPPEDDLARARREADRFIDRLKEMEDDDTYAFCWGMLVDMRLTVEKSGRVSAAQREAIHNVEVGAQRYEDAKENPREGSRRYEGFRGRRW